MFFGGFDTQIIIILNNVMSIGTCAFSGCETLSNVTIPSSVTHIVYDAFYGCKSLTIHTQKGSYAEQYALENNIPVINL